MKKVNEISCHPSWSRLSHPLVIRDLGHSHYEIVWENMKMFTETRTQETPDEIWFVEHPPVFTQGLAGKPEHILNAGDIPIIQTDRGGQITYHGPGQIVVYVLLDLRRLNIGIRRLVSLLENSIIHVLAEYGIQAANRPDAPGVYINHAKICSIGLRVRRSCTYHGIALNTDMDLSPFSRINPCGFQNLAMTQIRDFINPIDRQALKNKIACQLQTAFDQTPESC